ncbi:MAG: dTDP-4-dehydrorhamnose 3,5-epimerase [Deltaproteobacteria bacterium]|nr:dTDP-4-dehydrorhamnose 3,5-epimerase [Deltaproteobacteria bacterium]
MKVIPVDLPGIVLIEPRLFTDLRGYFLETYQAQRYSEHGITARFVQDNLSFSRRGVVRGLHYQLVEPQGKLVMVLQGEVLDLVVDIRQDSPTFGQWSQNTLSAENHRQLYVPPGFAHGFAVISATATVLYKVTAFYNPGDEYGIIWNDPNLGVDWPFSEAILSDKDSKFPQLRDVPVDLLPHMANSP